MTEGIDGLADELEERLRGRLDGTVEPRASLAEQTTLKVGGPAAALVEAESDADLARVGRICQDLELPWLVVGRGSNLLIADAGWPGVAIALGRRYRMLEIDGELVHAGAAEPLPSLAVRIARAGLTGFAWAAAVPGSLGGAVRMNAGAHGGEMRDHLVEAELFRLTSASREAWPADTLGLRYRASDLPADAVVVAATLRLAPGDPEATSEQIDEIRAWRREHQPIREPNCGSVFANPPGDSAGRLVDAVGAKGLTVGGARISETHANFIVTTPEATARDVRALIRAVRQRVADEFGVVLRPEVQMAGDFDDDGIGVDGGG